MSLPLVFRRLAPLVVTFAVVGGLLGGAAPAQAECAYVSPVYPGDAAPKPAIAAWMAGGAARSGLPGELPVMAALVESDLTNDPGGDADSVGYFQMRTSIWNTGPYAGYPTDPALQLQWFIDQAPAAEKGRAADDTQWGQWIADIERPAAQYRGRYQLQLQNARDLIAPGCAAATTPPPTTGAPTGAEPPPDTTPPKATVTLDLRQKVARSHALYATVVCPLETCTAVANGTVGGHGLATAAKVFSKPRTLKAAQRGRLTLIVGPTVRAAAARAAARGVPLRASITVTVTDTAGNPAATTLKTSLVRS